MMDATMGGLKNRPKLYVISFNQSSHTCSNPSHLHTPRPYMYGSQIPHGFQY